MLTIFRRNQIHTPANAHMVTLPSNPPQLEQFKVIMLPTPSVHTVDPKPSLNIIWDEQNSTAPTSVLDPKLAFHVNFLVSHAAQHSKMLVDMMLSTNGPNPN